MNNDIKTMRDCVITIEQANEYFNEEIQKCIDNFCEREGISRELLITIFENLPEETKNSIAIPIMGDIHSRLPNRE